MLRPLRSLLLAALFALVPGVAGAGDVYLGAKAGPMQVDVGGAEDPTNAGFVLGYEIGVVLGDVAIEGEYTTTLDEGAVSGSDIEVDTLGLFVALRTAGPVYFKARAGMASVDTTIGGSESSESGPAYGVGLGFGIGLAQLELEYTAMEDDTRFLSIGAQF